jgi:hypothetical protein
MGDYLTLPSVAADRGNAGEGKVVTHVVRIHAAERDELHTGMRVGTGEGLEHGEATCWHGGEKLQQLAIQGERGLDIAGSHDTGHEKEACVPSGADDIRIQAGTHAEHGSSGECFTSLLSGEHGASADEHFRTLGTNRANGVQCGRCSQGDLNEGQSTRSQGSGQWNSVLSIINDGDRDDPMRMDGLNHAFGSMGDAERPFG